MKKFFVFSTLIIILSIFMAITVICNDKISMVINNENINFSEDNMPIIQNNRVLVPFRLVFEKIGANVYWDSDNQYCEAVYNDLTVGININDTKVTLNNGKVIKSDVPAQIINGKTMVPLRVLAESLGADVSWDNSLRLVKINTLKSNVSKNDNSNTIKINEEKNDTSNIDIQFFTAEITDSIFKRMQGRSYPENCKIKLNDLRYIHILHKNINGETKEGELIVNKAIAYDILDIFKELYKNNYPIEKVSLIDEYNANDELSMRDNNSSAFCYRTISGSNNISKHGYGMAIDINPLYNPYVLKRKNGSLFVQPETAQNYVDRNKSYPYKIEKGDLCYRLFIEKGFKWGGDWSSPKDYQHFEK